MQKAKGKKKNKKKRKRKNLQMATIRRSSPHTKKYINGLNSI